MEEENVLKPKEPLLLDEGKDDDLVVNVIPNNVDNNGNTNAMIDGDINKMSVTIIISNEIAQVRATPDTTSVIKCVLRKSNNEYIATKIIKGWYYIKSVDGWVNYQDVYVPNPEQLFSYDEDDFKNNNHSDSDRTNIISSSEVFDIINASKNKLIDATKIGVTKDKVEMKLSDVIQEILMRLNDIENANKIVIPEIPKEGEGVALVCNKGQLSWQKISYNNITDLPLSKDVVIKNEF